MAKPRALLRRDRDGLRVQVARAAEALGLPDASFRLLSVYDDHNGVLEKIRRTFFDKAEPGTVWPVTPVPPEDLLPRLGSPEEKIWLLLNETYQEHNKFWVYEGNTTAIAAVLGQVGYKEVWAVSRKYEWMLHITDWDALIAYGTGMEQKLRELRQEKIV